MTLAFDSWVVLAATVEYLPSMRLSNLLFVVMAVQIGSTSSSSAGPLDDQRRIEVAMKAALPDAICERGGKYKAACYHKQETAEFTDASIVLTHEGRVVISIPFHAKYTDRLPKFYESLGIANAMPALVTCWSNSAVRKYNINQGPPEWVTPDLITICDQTNEKLLRLQIYANNRF